MILDFLEAPVSHSLGDILATHDLRASPFERKSRVENGSLPVGRICKFIHQSKHGALPHSIAIVSMLIISSWVGHRLVDGQTHGPSEASSADSNNVFSSG